jgi:hypothetical protein
MLLCESKFTPMQQSHGASHYNIKHVKNVSPPHTLPNHTLPRDHTRLRCMRWRARSVSTSRCSASNAKRSSASSGLSFAAADADDDAEAEAVGEEYPPAPEAAETVRVPECEPECEPASAAEDCECARKCCQVCAASAALATRDEQGEWTDGGGGSEFRAVQYKTLLSGGREIQYLKFAFQRTPHTEHWHGQI